VAGQPGATASMPGAGDATPVDADAAGDSGAAGDAAVVVELFVVPQPMAVVTTISAMHDRKRLIVSVLPGRCQETPGWALQGVRPGPTSVSGWAPD
jgi:hypothetical protein